MGSRSNRAGPQVLRSEEENLDAVNQSLAEKLSMKVGQLKNLAIDLDVEARDHLPLLDGVGDDMESGSMRLGGTSGRLRNIGRTRGLTGRRFTCYVGLGVCTVMVFVYYILLPMAIK
ncbi:putative protein-like protein [Orchesella cincta]|uniref:t-SNARE coiled-coil homology domain-containing protein n=1 Tax=Orchesella cincta TaxID=48709 RepID=A0A1D2N7C6_ORCCI|nr:putative protein-like protein [Orchesella cincta]